MTPRRWCSAQALQRRTEAGPRRLQLGVSRRCDIRRIALVGMKEAMIRPVLLLDELSRDRHMLAGLDDVEMFEDLRDEWSEVLNAISEADDRDNSDSNTLYVLLKFDA
jgi:hypothetical protein